MASKTVYALNLSLLIGPGHIVWVMPQNVTNRWPAVWHHLLNRRSWLHVLQHFPLHRRQRMHVTTPGCVKIVSGFTLKAVSHSPHRSLGIYRTTSIYCLQWWYTHCVTRAYQKGVKLSLKLYLRLLAECQGSQPNQHASQDIGSELGPNFGEAFMIQDGSWQRYNNSIDNYPSPV